MSPTNLLATNSVIVNLLNPDISIFESTIKAFDADAVPAVTLSNTPNSAVVIVVLSKVIEVSAVIVPVTAKLSAEVIPRQLIVPNPETFPSVSNV